MSDEPMFDQVIFWRYCIHCIHSSCPDRCTEWGPIDDDNTCHYFEPIWKHLTEYRAGLEEFDKKSLIALHMATYERLIRCYGMSPWDFDRYCEYMDCVDHYRHIPEMD